MSDNKYLEDILKSQNLADDSEQLEALRGHRADVEAVLLKHFEESSPTIRYGGSVAKGTLIVESYDLDVICYFKQDDTGTGETLKDIYYNTKAALENDYLIEEKPSALRLKSRNVSEWGTDFHIDVVPGRYTDDTKTDTFLYQSSGEKCRLKTNLDVHIAHVKDSGVIDAIRLMKLWRVRYGLAPTVKNFALELLTIEVLKDKKDSSLTDQLKHLLTELRDNSDSISIEDPANPEGNDLSELLNDGVRQAFASVASSTLGLIENSGWEQVFGSAETEDTGSKSTALRQAAAAVVTPSKPWATDL
ncbi:MAG TPA: hypothetical protein VGO56_14135 [Pyrinomonadaceae bacterium]|jgi:hypothetical protein|nr:hypothetical protein [Pyrinomonadaceae bacterium]